MPPRPWPQPAGPPAGPPPPPGWTCISRATARTLYAAPPSPSLPAQPSPWDLDRATEQTLSFRWPPSPQAQGAAVSGRCRGPGHTAGALGAPPALLDPLPFSKRPAPPRLQPVSGPLPPLVGLPRPALANATQVSPPPRSLPMAGSEPSPGPCSLRVSLCLDFAHPVSPLSWGRLPPAQGLAEGGACRLVMPGSNGRAAGCTHRTGGCRGPKLPGSLLCLGAARLRRGPPHPARKKEPVSVLPNL